MQRGDLPESLGSAFGVAAARRAGTSRGRLRARDLERTFYGARALSGVALVADEDDDARRTYPRSKEVRGIHTRAAQYAPVMPEGAFFVGVTACALWDGPLPSSLFQRGQAYDPDVLEVGVHWPHRAPRGAGVTGRALRPALVHAVVHPESGLPVASPASTWALLAPVLPHPYDLVAVADRFARIARPPHSRPDKPIPPQLATLEQLAAAVDAGRREGIERLRAALPLVRTGAASRPETWTRLTLVDGGLPEPLLDHDVFDELRRFVARVDMAYPQWKIVIEYEGEHHNTSEEWEHDID